MKKFLFFISLFLFFIVPVKADTYILHVEQASNLSQLRLDYIDTLISQNNNYQYYAVFLNFNSNGYFYDNYFVMFFNNESFSYGSECNGDYSCLFAIPSNDILQYTVSENNVTSTNSNQNLMFFNNDSHTYTFYDSNYDFTSAYDYSLQGFYNDNINISSGDSIPKYKNLLQYNSWSDYENNHLQGYSEVNLDNYEYVLLSLKDYSQKNPFQTNFQVKGQIGITPIYNYGQTSKDSVTGAQVQDRCNVNYSNYTAYPFYILQTDLQNNVIYAVKECGSGSSFKYDTTIFNISYITSSNVDNPTITIDGKTYDVIPYNDLPSTATNNEENNYIPGESGSATDTGGIDSAIKTIQQSLSTLWNTFTYFTDLVGLIFSSLPNELRTVLLSAFIVAITIGLIKLFVK